MESGFGLWADQTLGKDCKRGRSPEVLRQQRGRKIGGNFFLFFFFFPQERMLATPRPAVLYIALRTKLGRAVHKGQQESVYLGADNQGNSSFIVQHFIFTFGWQWSPREKWWRKRKRWLLELKTSGVEGAGEWGRPWDIAGSWPPPWYGCSPFHTFLWLSAFSDSFLRQGCLRSLCQQLSSVY